MAKTTFLGPVHSKGGFIGDLTGNTTGSFIPSAPQQVFPGDVGDYPANEYAGCFIVDTANGDTLKFSDGTNWKAVDLT